MQFVYEKKGSAVYADHRNYLACSKHLHDHIELVLLRKGTVRATADDFDDTLHAGEAFISFPNQVHSFVDISKQENFIMIFPPDILPEYSKLFRSYIPKNPIIPYNTSLLEPVAAELVKRHLKKDPIDSGIVRGCLLIIVGHLLEQMTFKKVESADLGSLKSILIYCGQNYEHEITLDDVAEHLHISKYYISHLFSEKLKTSFTDYINNLRITEARRLLEREDMNITEVSYAVGFSSIRSFNRNFLKQIGMSPRDYRSWMNVK